MKRRVAPLLSPRVGALASAERARLGRVWLDHAHAAQASVAAIHRLAMDLLALRAPADLVLDAGRAAAEKVHHVHLCGALASAYLGRSAGLDRVVPEPDTVRARTLVEVAEWTARHVAVGSTVAAIQCETRGAEATDPAIRRVLEILARDHTAHARLAWRVLQWAILEGSDPVIRAVGPIVVAPDLEAEVERSTWSA
jgi:hypothetical protein